VVAGWFTAGMGKVGWEVNLAAGYQIPANGGKKQQLGKPS